MPELDDRERAAFVKAYDAMTREEWDVFKTWCNQHQKIASLESYIEFKRRHVDGEAD